MFLIETKIRTFYYEVVEYNTTSRVTAAEIVSSYLPCYFRFVPLISERFARASVSISSWWIRYVGHLKSYTPKTSTTPTPLSFYHCRGIGVFLSSPPISQRHETRRKANRCIHSNIRERGHDGRNHILRKYVDGFHI